jgi:hypothetical protein
MFLVYDMTLCELVNVDEDGSDCDGVEWNGMEWSEHG